METVAKEVTRRKIELTGEERRHKKMLDAELNANQWLTKGRLRLSSIQGGLAAGIEETDGFKEFQKMVAARAVKNKESGDTVKETEISAEHIARALTSGMLNNVVFLAAGETLAEKRKNNILTCKELLNVAGGGALINRIKNRGLTKELAQAHAENLLDNGKSVETVRGILKAQGYKLKGVGLGGKVTNWWRRNISGEDELPNIKVSPVVLRSLRGENPGTKISSADGFDKLNAKLMSVRKDAVAEGIEQFSKDYDLTGPEGASILIIARELMAKLLDDHEMKVSVLGNMDKYTKEFCENPPPRMEQGKQMKSNETVLNKAAEDINNYNMEEIRTAAQVKAPDMIYDKGDEKHAQITYGEKAELDRLQETAPAGKDLLSDYQEAKFRLGDAIGLHHRLQNNVEGIKVYAAFGKAFLSDYIKNPEDGSKEAALLSRRAGWETEEKDIDLWLRKASLEKDGSAYKTKISQRQKIRKGIKDADAAEGKWLGLIEANMPMDEQQSTKSAPGR